MSSKSKRKITSESTRAPSPESSDVSRRPSVFERLGPGAPSIQSQTSERGSGERSEKCRNWLRTGTCCYGSNCRYQHGPFNSPSHRSKKERDRSEKDFRHKARSKKEEENKEPPKQHSPSPPPKQKEPKSSAAPRSRKGDHDGKIKSTVVVTRLRSPASDQTEREKQQTGSWEDDSDDWPIDVSQLDYKEELTLERKRQQLQRELAELEIQKERMLNEQESVIITKTVALGDSSGSSRSRSGSTTSTSGSSGSSTSTDDSDDDNSSSISTSSQSQMQRKLRKAPREHEPKPPSRKAATKEVESTSTPAKLVLPKESAYAHLSPPQPLQHERKSKKRSKENKEQTNIIPEWKGDHPDETSKSSLKSRGPHTPSPPRGKGEKASISSGREVVDENWKSKRHKRKHDSSPGFELSSHLPSNVSSSSPPRHHRADVPSTPSKKEKDKDKSKKSSKGDNEGKSKKKAKEASPVHIMPPEKPSHSSSKQESSKKGHSSPYHSKRESEGKRDQSSHAISHPKKSIEYKESSKHKDRPPRDSSGKKSKSSAEKDRSSYRRGSYSPSHRKLDSFDSISHRSLSPNEHVSSSKGEKRKRSPSPREKDVKGKEFKRMYVEPSKSRDDNTAYSASPISGGDVDYQGSSRSKSRKSDEYLRQEYMDDRRESGRSKHDRDKEMRSDRSRNSDIKGSGRRQDRKSMEKYPMDSKSKSDSRSSRDSLGLRNSSSLDRRDRSRDDKEVQYKRDREKEARKNSPHRKASPLADQSWMDSGNSYKGSSRRSYNDRRKNDRDREKERETESRRESSIPHASVQDSRSQPQDSSREPRSKDSSHHRDTVRRRDGRQYGSEKKSHKDRELTQWEPSPPSKLEDIPPLKEKPSLMKRSPPREPAHEKLHSKERRSHHRSKEGTPPEPPPPPPPPPPVPPKQVREPSPANSSSSWEDSDKRIVLGTETPTDVDRNVSHTVSPEKSQNETSRPRHEPKADVEVKQEIPALEETLPVHVVHELPVEEPPIESVATHENQAELVTKTDPISPVSENSSVPASPVPESQGIAPLSPVSNHEEERDREEVTTLEVKDTLSGAEEFSDWSDDDDDLLTREDMPEDGKHWDDLDRESKDVAEIIDQTSPEIPSKSDTPVKEALIEDEKSDSKASTQEITETVEEITPVAEKSESYQCNAEQEEPPQQQQQQGQDFEDDLGEFESISDDELEALIEEPEEGKQKDDDQRVGIVDALDVDWSQLMSDPKSLPRFEPGSARKMFTPAAVLSRIGFSKALAGKELTELIIAKCQEELQEGSKLEAAENQPEESAKTPSVNKKFVLEHPIASFHAAIVKRRQERENIIHNVGPYRRALCARQDLKIRQFLLKPSNKVFDTSAASVPQPHPVDKELYKLSLQLLQKKKSIIKALATSVEVSC